MRINSLKEAFEAMDSTLEPEKNKVRINHVSEIPYSEINDYQKTVNSTFHQMLGDYYIFWEKLWKATTKEEAIKAMEDFDYIVKCNTVFCAQYLDK